MTGPTGAAAPPDFGSLSGAYGAAIEAGSFPDAERVVRDALAAGATGAEVFAHVLTPAMYRIGERWERSEITVADEHRATAISNRIVGVVYEALAVEMPTSKERVIVAAVEGDQHVMGLRMIADVLEGAGYETLYLGADTSLAGLLASIARYGPSVVALGATAPWSAAKLVDTVREVRAATPSLPIVVGGAQAERAALAAGADRVHVATDATTIVALVESVIEPRRSA